MNTQNSGSTATISQTLEIYAISGVDESSRARAKARFEELKHRGIWTDAIDIARYNLDAEERQDVTQIVLGMLLGQPEGGSRWGKAHGVEELAQRLNAMFRKAEAPFFKGSVYTIHDGDEAYSRSILSWLDFWQFPSHEDDILHDLGVAAQAVLVLIAACPLDVDDLFGRKALEGERELANIFGEDPEWVPSYGTLHLPAAESWMLEALR